MKKILMVLVCCLVMCGCGAATEGVSQAEYDKVVSERDAYKEELEALKSEITDSEELKEESSESAPKLSGTDLNEMIDIKEYSYKSGTDTTWYIMEVTNDSPVTISAETNVIAKDADGNTIGAASSSEDAIESGYSICLLHMFDEGEPASYEYTISVKEDDYYAPILSDLSYEESDTGNKVIITCTNNGDEAAEFVEGTVLFFAGDKLLRHSTTYFTDDDSEIKPGNTIAEEFDFYGDEPYDNYKVYFTGSR